MQSMQLKISQFPPPSPLPGCNNTDTDQALAQAGFQSTTTDQIRSCCCCCCTTPSLSANSFSLLPSRNPCSPRCNPCRAGPAKPDNVQLNLHLVNGTSHGTQCQDAVASSRWASPGRSCCSCNSSSRPWLLSKNTLPKSFLLHVLLLFPSCKDLAPRVCSTARPQAVALSFKSSLPMVTDVKQ
jgi:hypothetical protein